MQKVLGHMESSRYANGSAYLIVIAIHDIV